MKTKSAYIEDVDKKLMNLTDFVNDISLNGTSVS